MTYVLPPEYETYDHPFTTMSSQVNSRTSRRSGSQTGYRIEKPKSNHTSPRPRERRRTTSGKRFATLDDHLNHMLGITGNDETEQRRRGAARPMSWHPSTHSQARFQAPPPSVQTSGPDWPRHSSYGSDYYSFSAQSSMHPQRCPPYASVNGQRDSQFSDQSFQSEQYTISALSTPCTEPMPWYPSQWTQQSRSQPANGSVDFLLIQQTPTGLHLDDEKEDSGPELVALGLYDAPESGLSWNSSSLMEGTGKGLKLEETWQPPEESDNEEEADEASSDDGSVDELPPPQQTATQLPIHTVKPQVHGNMAGQSFFFDEDDTKGYFYPHLQQQPMPLQPAPLGYGWL